jgi:hypothetical protein
MLFSVIAAARPSLRGASEDDDVPASVTCAMCGAPDAECPGCAAPGEHRPEPRTPWEDPQLSRWQRLLRTARLVTLDGEAFFGTLPDGSVRSALGFAFLCELLAIGSLVLAWLPVVYAFVPGYVDELLSDPSRRRLSVFVIAAAIPALSGLMVGLHVLWAIALELGLVFAGARGRMAHCVRYALYSCGWDFVTSPCGFVAGCAELGFRAARTEIHTAVRVPRFATTAYVGRARALSDKGGRIALLIAVVLTGSIVLVTAFGLGVALVRAMV